MAVNERHPGMIKLLLELHMSRNAEQKDETESNRDISITINGLPNPQVQKTVISDAEFVEVPTETDKE